MRAFLLVVLLLASPALAQPIPGPAPIGCTPVTGVLASLNATLALPCPNASGYLITINTTPGQSALIGTMASTDSVTGGNRLLFKTGVGPLDVSSVPMTGSQGFTEYRTIGGGVGQAVTLSAYTSGSATVTIYGSYNPVAFFPNGAFHTAEEAAMRNGKAYSASTGIQVVTVGQYLSMILANPSTSGQRAIITLRKISCNNPTGQVPAQYYALTNPTVNVPSTAVTISNRKTGGTPSILTSAYTASSATYPDTSPTTPLTSRTADFVPTGGGAGGPGAIQRTLEPGQSYAYSVLGVANGLSTNPSCVIDTGWYEESIN